jgi:hypothetical protein
MITNRSILKPVRAVALAALAVLASPARSQDLLGKDAPDPFRPVEGWRRVTGVSAVAGETAFKVDGDGPVLVNGAAKGDRAPYLLTREEHGDVRIHLEFMIPKGSNAGVYLMGRYEVQILDSFGRQPVGSDDLGAIYQRWDPSRPKGQEGFGGIPPKTNAAKPPGEWQTLDITFRAPRFDGGGKKLRDATFEEVRVNGVLVQQNASTGGPTRAAPLEGEAAQGPVAIQGDHGPIAIRSFVVTPLDPSDAARIAELDRYWAEVSRAVKEGDFEAYRATCHAEGVLVSGGKGTSQPLADALARWQQEFIDTREGKLEASVEFRLSRRLGDATTAHESGIFRYRSRPAGGEAKQEYVHFEGLLVKRQDGWKILMEYQKGPATEAEWQALEKL